MSSNNAKNHRSHSLEQEPDHAEVNEQTTAQRELGFQKESAVLNCKPKADFQDEIQAMFG